MGEPASSKVRGFGVGVRRIKEARAPDGDGPLTGGARRTMEGRHIYGGESRP